MKKNLLLFIFLSTCFLWSCKSTKVPHKNTFLPTIHQPTYKPYNIQSERGYYVSFQISPDDLQPVAVIFNKIKKEISPSDESAGNYNVNIIAQTAAIPNYEVIGSTLPNGILFLHEGKYYLKKVQFKRKN